ncbi:MAG: serine/threonine protein kinase [Anaerolineae bacterium]|nr:serine/threonine protein kinase [Anaerolineae bacterium]
MKLDSFGSYSIHEQIKSGQREDVYRAFDTQAQRPVIIQHFTLPTTSAAGQQLIERLRQSMALHHPYIVRIYEVGIVDDRPYMVTERLYAQTLADALAGFRVANQTPVLAHIARQLKLIATALDYAHTQGVVHGRLNTHNILLTDIEEPVLMGFGLHVAEPGDKESDLLALGTILYEWLTGSSPSENEAIPFESLDLPVAIRTVILKALAQDPAQRYGSAQALAGDFILALPDPLLEKQATDPQFLSTIGRYQVEDELGRRGPVIVYRAYDEKLGRQVAIKLLPAQSATDPAFRTSFKQEIELIATLEHPCIVKVYDFGEYEQRPYVVMPYLNGGTLETHLRAESLLTPQVLTPIVERVAAALDEAHGRGIIHGQVMPSNILFDGQDQAYLSDFSVSALAETETNLATLDKADIASTYMSPEQIQALISSKPTRPDARSDVYALGIIIFEALTGQVPYQAVTPYETALAHLKEPIPILHQINPALPKAYQTIINRSLAKDPDKRYATAGTLAARLKEIQSGRWHMSRISDLIESPPQHARYIQNKRMVKVDPPPLRATSTKKFGRYHLRWELGRGGMGVVYLAYDPQLKRQVALKVLPRHLAMTSDLRRRFQHEAKLIARLNHDAIAHVYDVGDYDGQLFIVMRYLSGGTLAEKLTKDTLKLRHFGPIIKRVAAALDAAHASHIIHYDVKPGNILFDAKGDAFLADFGIAVLQEQIEDDTLENTLGGTPKYMSPEQVKAITKQIDRKEVDGRSDIYSLGVVLFEMLTGRVPYQADTARSTALAHLTEPVPDIMKTTSNLPVGSQEVFTKVLAKNPAERYQTAQEFAQDVTDLTSGRWLLRQLTE